MIALTVLTLLLVLPGCSGGGPGMKRMPLPVNGRVDKKILDKYSLKSFESRHGNYNYKYLYSVSEGATFKGGLLVLHGIEGGSKQLHFNPGLSGTYGIHFDVQLYVEGVIGFKIYHGKKIVLDKEFTERGIFAIDPVRDLDLSDGDRVTLKVSGKGVVLLGEPVFYKKTVPEDREYVFIICADTLRADHLPVYGYPRDTAPNTVEFSKDGVVFENAYAQSPWTLPSHMSLFTSLYEYNHGVKKNGALDPAMPFLVEALSKRFATRSINGGGWLKGVFGFYRGFDYYKSYGRCGATPQSAKWLFHFAMEDLKFNRRPRNFYFLHSYQMHAPYQPPRKFLEHFNRKPARRRMGTPLQMTAANTAPEKIEKTRQIVTDLYDGEIRAFDHWFGEFIGFLKKKNIYDRAMIIFLSDHGEEFFEHKGWGHSHAVYNEVARVPLIIKFPEGRFKGTRISHEAGLIDVMPTILNYYGVDWQSQPGGIDVDGRDLLPVIKGKRLKRALTTSITSGFFFEGQPFKIGLVENRRKIILTVPRKRALASGLTLSPRGLEFYDLSGDPAESKNLRLKRMREIERFYPLFKSIAGKGRFFIKQEGNKAVIDQQTRDALKSLGYL
jgi:arylsulfatase A-like enzyme